MVLTQTTKIHALNADEIDFVAGGLDTPPGFGFWDWVPGFRPPWTSINDDPATDSILRG